MKTRGIDRFLDTVDEHEVVSTQDDPPGQPAKYPPTAQAKPSGQSLSTVQDAWHPSSKSQTPPPPALESQKHFDEHPPMPGLVG